MAEKAIAERIKAEYLKLPKNSDGDIVVGIKTSGGIVCKTYETPVLAKIGTKGENVVYAGEVSIQKTENDEKINIEKIDLSKITDEDIYFAKLRAVWGPKLW